MLHVLCVHCCCFEITPPPLLPTPPKGRHIGRLGGAGQPMHTHPPTPMHTHSSLSLARNSAFPHAILEPSKTTRRRKLERAVQSGRSGGGQFAAL